jgi:cytochrome oxidase Cu insertion factor (SCO1/SenC/PrrC family)
MSKASARPRPPRPNGAARRRADARRRRRTRALVASSIAAVLAVVGVAVGLHVANRPSGSPGGSSGPPAVSLPVGSVAPDAAFTTIGGRTESIASLRGKPTLVWLVTTWCSSCQAGTQAMAQHIAALAADGVRVVEVENYQDLGQSGPSVSTFAKTLAGSAFTDPDWTFGEASAALTRTYNPKAYLDLYYLIDAQGKISYVNSSPGSTMPQLLAAAKAFA